MKKKIKIVFILIILFSFCVAYAFLNGTVTVNGTTGVKSNVWDVHFENIRIIPGSVEADQLPVIDNITSTINFNVSLNEPGDYYCFTVDVVNKGTMEAMIDSINKTPNLTEEQSKYLNYVIEYENGNPILGNQLIKQDSFLRLKIRLEYKKDLIASELPKSLQSLMLSFTLNFVQNDGFGFEVSNNGLYKVNVVSGSGLEIGNEICIESECFNVISSDNDSVTMISKYNLYVGYEVSADFVPSLILQPKILQDSRARGYVAGHAPYIGTVYFADSANSGINYSSYNGSKAEWYVNEYKEVIESLGIIVDEARLITYEELIDQNTFACVSNSYCSSKYPWLYYTTFWSMSAYNEKNVWRVGADAHFYYDNYSIATYFGIRPVITISKNYI